MMHYDTINREKQKRYIITDALLFFLYVLCHLDLVIQYSVAEHKIIFSVSHLFFRHHSSSLRLCSEQKDRQT